jgi:hypothetical protein
MEFQMRPEFAVPTEIATDARVRRAVAHLIDREALLEVVTAGKGLLDMIPAGAGNCWRQRDSTAAPTASG